MSKPFNAHTLEEEATAESGDVDPSVRFSQELSAVIDGLQGQAPGGERLLSFSTMHQVLHPLDSNGSRMVIHLIA